MSFILFTNCNENICFNKMKSCDIDWDSLMLIPFVFDLNQS